MEPMNNIVTAAIILGAAIIIATILAIYFSPYHSCVRALDHEHAKWRCADFR